MKNKDIPQKPHAPVESTLTPKAEINYFNTIILLVIYGFVLLVVFKSKIGRNGFEKLKQNREEYRAVKDSFNLETLFAYRNGQDFLVCNYIKKNTKPETDILLLPNQAYLSTFKKDFNHPLVSAIKFYYFGAKLKVVRFGQPGYEKATIALGLDKDGEVVPIKLDTDEKRKFLYDKFAANQSLN